jgi:ankyrin repeat protein
MDDHMFAVEEERRLKEEVELREFKDTIILDEETYFSSRDFISKGRVVHPSGKQNKEVQIIGQSLRIVSHSKKMSSSLDESQMEYYDENSIKDFDLSSRPRIFVCGGFINKRENDKALFSAISSRVTRRYLLVFNDLILVTTKNEKDPAVTTVDIQQILWIKDLRINRCEIADDADTEFELIIAKTRNRPKTVLNFICDSIANKQFWVTEIEDALLAYHKETDLIKQLGWFNEIIQGTFFSSAYLGDENYLRRHLRFMNVHGGSIDRLDNSGMSALHWAALKGHEVCVRLLLDRGADVDCIQGGINTPFLLACAAGHDTLARLLVDRGAFVRARNHKDQDAVFMTVVYGHASRGLPWILQLLNAKGLDLNECDCTGSTPLHVCAERNLARPVRMLVDSGADVNARHELTHLTPLQMACSTGSPDVETIRSFLDKGAYPNWKDLQGRTAFDLAFHSRASTRTSTGRNQKQKQSSADAIDATPAPPAFHQRKALNAPPPSVIPEKSGRMFTARLTTPVKSKPPMGEEDDTQTEVSPLQSTANGSENGSSDNSNNSGELRSVKERDRQRLETTDSGRWRAMEGTLEKVGDWAVKALPALLEISKKGGRFEDKDLDTLRPSFRAAVMEARSVWEKKCEPKTFAEFILVSL